MTRAHRGRVERAVEPDRVDLRQARRARRTPRHEEEQAEGLGRERRPQLRADDVALGAPAARELRVLLPHEHREVGAEQPDDQRGDDEDVDDEEAADDVVARELAAEHEEREPRPEERDRQQHRVRDAQPGAREQVVGEAVAGEPVGEAEQQQAERRPSS